MPAEDTLERTKRILSEALELPADERARFLREACGDDEALRIDIESLLGHDASTGGVPDAPIVSLFDGDTDDTGVFEGKRIGPYKVVREIGRGGMGTVALAVRTDDFAKEVALKVIQPQLLTPNAIRRFENERQILAELTHPGIAQIHDGGETLDGRPYLAMEYVDGEPIDTYCRRHDLSVRRRLQLFQQVCTALHAAHQNLVVHRDVKPSNILVTKDAQPKLVDFGIAKRLGVDATSMTRLGENPMTIRYASPEQVQGRPLTTAADVYALGVVLYELLTGVHPYVVDGDSPVSLERAITEVEPPRPSTVRQKDPETHFRKLDADLDSIVLKAMNKAPEKRYNSAQQLAEDVERYLDGQPVIAREGTWTYRTAKFVRRNVVALGVASFVVALGLSFLVTTIRLSQEAELARQRNEGVIKFFNRYFEVVTPDLNRGEPLPPRFILDAGVKALESVDDRLTHASLLDTIGDMYVKLGFNTEAERPLTRRLEILREHHGGDHEDVAEAINDLAGCYYRVERFQETAEFYREALDMKKRLNPDDVYDDDVDIAKAMTNLAGALTAQGTFDEAEQLYNDSLDIRRKETPPSAGEIARSLRSLANLYYFRGESEKALPLLDEALDIRRGLEKTWTTRTASIHSTYGRVYLALGRLDEAEAEVRRALEIREDLYDPKHPNAAISQSDLAAVLLARGKVDEAEAVLLPALEILVQEKGEDSWYVAVARNVLGEIYLRRAELEQAEPLLRESYAVLEHKRGPDAVFTREARQRLDELARLHDQ